jgi:hypothetical protein
MIGAEHDQKIFSIACLKYDFLGDFKPHSVPMSYQQKMDCCVNTNDETCINNNDRPCITVPQQCTSWQ